jgi:hypothetical protein
MGRNRRTRVFGARSAQSQAPGARAGQYSRAMDVRPLVTPSSASFSALRPLRGSAYRIVLTEESIFDFRVDAMEPLLSALGLLPIRRDFGLKLGNPIFGRAKLVRKPLRRVDCMSAVLLGKVSSFA